MKSSLIHMLLILILFAFPLAVGAQQATPGPATGGEQQAVPHHQHGSQAAEPAGQHHGGMHGGMHQGMMERCKEMMAKNEQVQAEIKAMDDRVDEKIAAMNAAKGDAKIAAMAAAITELVSQRKEMREKFATMQFGGMCKMMCSMMGEGPTAHGGHMMGGRGMGMGQQMCPKMEKTHKEGESPPHGSPGDSGAKRGPS